jgi:Mg-chelatase subunit ChlI
VRTWWNQHRCRTCSPRRRHSTQCATAYLQDKLAAALLSANIFWQERQDATEQKEKQEEAAAGGVDDVDWGDEEDEGEEEHEDHREEQENTGAESEATQESEGESGEGQEKAAAEKEAKQESKEEDGEAGLTDRSRQEALPLYFSSGVAKQTITATQQLEAIDWLLRARAAAFLHHCYRYPEHGHSNSVMLTKAILTTAWDSLLTDVQGP